MAADAELDRLKIEQSRAFECKQVAFQVQEQSWARTTVAREAMDRAYQQKQLYYEHNNSLWQALQRVRDNNGPQIDRLNSQQQDAYERMKQAFDNASNAHNSRDGESARRYADEGHRHKQDSQVAVSERRQLIAEIRELSGRHVAARPAFDQAKRQFDQAKLQYEYERAKHMQNQANFKQCKVEFDRTSAAFRSRLTELRSEQDSRKAKRTLIAERAGIPYQYRNDLWVTKDTNGTINIYFGGAGRPDGPGHGHYALDSSGSITYRRDPYDAHGSQNFISKPTGNGWEPKSSRPPDAGVIAGTNHVVSFKTGGRTGDQTLIADGDFSDDRDGFDDKHNHYGSKSEGGWIEEDRGHYSGPSH